MNKQAKNNKKQKTKKQKQTTKQNKQTKNKYNKDSKQPSKCLTRAETSVVIIVGDGVLCEVCGYTVVVSYRRNINQVPEKLCLGH